MGDATKLAMFNGIHMIHGASGFRVTLGILFSDKATWFPGHVWAREGAVLKVGLRNDMARTGLPWYEIYWNLWDSPPWFIPFKRGPWEFKQQSLTDLWIFMTFLEKNIVSASPCFFKCEGTIPSWVTSCWHDFLVSSGVIKHR